MRKITLFVLCMCLTICAGATNFSSYFFGYVWNTNIYYGFMNGTNYLTVTYTKKYSGNLVIPNTAVNSDTETYPVNAIDENAFTGLAAITSVSIPESVTTIGDGAFIGCVGLTSISVNSSNKAYASDTYGALYKTDGTSNSNLRQLIAYPSLGSATTYSAPDGVSTIADFAFYQANNLSSISLPASVQTLGTEANINSCFFQCTALSAFAVNSSNSYFESANDVLFNKGQSTLIAYPSAKSGTSYAVPGTVSTIYGGAFAFASLLNKFTVDAANTSFSTADDVLYNAAQTEMVCYPAAKTGNSFAIPSTVTKIKPFAFCELANLNSVTIPASVTSIENNAFYNCGSLTGIHVKSTTPIDLTNNFDVFYNMNPNCTLYVPEGSLNNYIDADQWSDFATIKEESTAGYSAQTENKVTVSVANKLLTISNIAAGQQVDVLDISGKVIFSKKSSAEKLTIKLAQKGIYLVKTRQQMTKVIY